METLTQLAPYAAAIPVVFMANESLKQAGMSSRWSGIVNIALGLVVGVALASYMGRDVLEGVLGVVFGLATGGGYSGVKAAVTTATEEPSYM
jgi:hypothetical protein